MGNSAPRAFPPRNTLIHHFPPRHYDNVSVSGLSREILPPLEDIWKQVITSYIIMRLGVLSRRRKGRSLVPPDAYMRLAAASFLFGRFPQQVFEEALNKNPKEPRLLMIMGISAFLQNDPKVREKGEKKILKAFEISKEQNQLRLDTALIFHNLAGHYYLTKDYPQAVNLYTRATKMRPNYPQAWYLLALAQRLSKNFDQAYLAIRKALELDSTKFEIWLEYFNIGASYHINSRFDRALNIYKECETVMPKNPELHLNKGSLYYVLGQYEEAVMSFKQAADLSPKNMEAKLGLAQSYKRSKRIIEAIEAYRQVLFLYPKSTEAQLDLDSLLLQNKSMDLKESSK